MTQFSEGQWVKWSSQARGGSATKVGKVVVIVAAGIKPADGRRLLFFREMNGHFVSMLGGGGPRLETSYLVAVPQRGRAKPRLYWPHAALLEPATDADHCGLADVQVP